MNELHSVVVTGAGAITARGDLTLNGGSPPREANASGERNASDAGGSGLVIEAFKLESYLASQKTYLDRCSALALAGCALALNDAGVQWPPAAADDSNTEDFGASDFGASDFGIALGTHLGCVETMKLFWDKTTQSGVRGASPLLFSHSYFNTPISLCAIEFGLKGFHATFCAGHDSGLAAARAALDAIRLGHARAMLCGGVEALTPARALFEPSGPAPSSGEAAAPDDVSLGEAAAFFVLEEAEHAARRGANTAHPFDDGLLAAALRRRDAVRSRWGDCGGAESALALADYLLARDL